MKKVTDYVADFLVANGVSVVFELSGGMISHLLDSFAAQPAIKLISMHHEQAAAFAAEGVGRFTDHPGVALGTSGPGALNLISGIASCYYDSVPAVFITGDVQTYMELGDRRLRQFGLQECPFPSVAAPIAKAAFSVRRAGDVHDVLKRSFVTALSERPGPVVVELPFDVQGQSQMDEPAPIEPPPRKIASQAEITRALKVLLQAQRPLILAGGGARRRDAAELLRRFAEATGIPVTTSIAGLDVIESAHPLRVGLVGTYGTRAANLVMGESDAVLVVGSRLDAGVIGADTAGWERNRSVVRVDCDAAELSERLKTANRIQADSREFLAAAIPAIPIRAEGAYAAWRRRVDTLLREHSDTAEHPAVGRINPNLFMRQLSEASSRAAAYVVDAGQHTWWAAQSVKLTGTQRFLAGTGLWAMGAALPAAIGIAIAANSPVVVIVGDASFQLNIQELNTVMRYRLPLKIALINNRSHGMVRQFQDEFFGGRYPSTVWGYAPPDFMALAAAFGLPHAAISRPEEVDVALEQFWAKPSEPFLLDVAVPLETNVYPYVPLGRSLKAMVPSAALTGAIKRDTVRNVN